MTAPMQLPHIYVRTNDGEEFTFQASTIDTVAYERSALKHPDQFGPPDKTPMTWGQFLAFHVCVKTRRVMPDMSLREFEKATELAVAFIPENGDGAVDPTQLEATDE